MSDIKLGTGVGIRPKADEDWRGVGRAPQVAMHRNCHILYRQQLLVVQFGVKWTFLAFFKLEFGVSRGRYCCRCYSQFMLTTLAKSAQSTRSVKCWIRTALVCLYSAGACDVMTTRIKCPGYETCRRWFTQRASWRSHAACCSHAQPFVIRRTDKNGKVAHYPSICTYMCY